MVSSQCLLMAVFHQIEANAESEENRKVEEQLHSTTASSTITTSATRKPLTTHPKAPGAVLHVRDGSNVTVNAGVFERRRRLKMRVDFRPNGILFDRNRTAEMMPTYST